MVLFKDISQIISICLQIGMWATPILWDINTIPEKWQKILKINPLVYIVNGYRSAVYKQEWFFQDFFSTVYFSVRFAMYEKSAPVQVLALMLLPSFTDVQSEL